MTSVEPHPLDIPAFLLVENRGKPYVRENQKPLIGSYTMLNCYHDICPHQAWHRYVIRDVPFVETAEMKWGNTVHSAMELRISGGKPLPEDMRQWESFAVPLALPSAQVEQKLGITADGRPTGFFDADVRFRVKVDYSLVHEDTAYIIDWKTGKPREDSYELEIGAMHLSAKHPQLRMIKGQYAWLRENRMGQLHDLSDVGATWRKSNRILADMEKARETGEWPKRQGPLCGWCGVKSCEFNKS